MENVNFKAKFVINVFVLWHFLTYSIKMTHTNIAFFFCCFHENVATRAECQCHRRCAVVTSSAKHF